MIWEKNISFEGFQNRIDGWHNGDPPIDAQFALDLIFKTLIDDKYNYEYLTSMPEPETTEQTNSVMLDLILFKYSREYRKFRKKKRRNK